jgi:hypothetical protein
MSTDSLRVKYSPSCAITGIVSRADGLPLITPISPPVSAPITEFNNVDAASVSPIIAAALNAPVVPNDNIESGVAKLSTIILACAAIIVACAAAIAFLMITLRSSSLAFINAVPTLTNDHYRLTYH